MLTDKLTTGSDQTGPRGVFTSEFLLTVLVIVAATAMLGFDKIDPELWGGLAGGSTGAYSIARGLAK